MKENVSGCFFSEHSVVSVNWTFCRHQHDLPTSKASVRRWQWPYHRDFV